MTSALVIAWFLCFGGLVATSLWYLAKLFRLQSYLADSRPDLLRAVCGQSILFGNSLAIPRKLRDLQAVSATEGHGDIELASLTKSCILWYRVSSILFIVMVLLTIYLWSVAGGA